MSTPVGLYKMTTVEFMLLREAKRDLGHLSSDIATATHIRQLRNVLHEVLCQQPMPSDDAAAVVRYMRRYNRFGVRPRPIAEE